MKQLRLSAFLLAATLGATAVAAGLNQATLTKVVNDVDVIPAGGRPQTASLGEVIRGRTGVRTGENSRAQLTFPDATLARLGENTLFSFERGTRMLDLENGAILLQVPKDAGGATIRSAPITAAITGTTLMMEYSPGNPGTVKVIVLEGTVRVSLKGRLGESVLVGAGEMIGVASNARSLPEPVTVDVKRIMKTSRLVKAGELEAYGLIVETIDEQQRQLQSGKLHEAGPLLPGAQPNNPALQSADVMNSINNRFNATRQQPPVSAPAPPPAFIAPTPPPTPVPTPPHYDPYSGYSGGTITTP